MLRICSGWVAAFKSPTKVPTPATRASTPERMSSRSARFAVMRDTLNLRTSSCSEGTRSPDGNLQRFFRGAFVLSVRNGAPIVPVIIDGTGDILGKGSVRIVPRPVRVRVLPPIDPASVGGDDRRLRTVVHARMEAELLAMRGGGR